MPYCKKSPAGAFLFVRFAARFYVSLPVTARRAAHSAAACSGAPAIRNAIYNATGVAIDQDPITPHVLFQRFTEEGLIRD